MSGPDSKTGGGEPFVMVPCRLIDEVLPTLKDTEMRLLLVVLRQTLGRRNPDGTLKERDWLSHSQLKSRTGRAGEAVSSAVDSLVRRGLIEVRGEGGRLLADPAARRREHRRLYFAPGAAVRPMLRRSPGGGGKPNGKAKTTGEGDSYSPGRSRFSGPVDREAVEREKARIRERLARLSAR